MWQPLSSLGAVATLHYTTIYCGLVFKFMFLPATVSVSVHIRAWQGGTAATQ
jgi:hypothetical protein